MIQLNNVMGLITGTVKSTELQWLPVLSNITPPKLRRETALFRELKNSWINGKWVLLKRFRTSQGKCAFLMHRWGYSNATNCDCGHLSQTMDHIIDDCPIHAFEDGMLSLHEGILTTPEAIQYLFDLNIDL
jgi:hypothetical protein